MMMKKKKKIKKEIKDLLKNIKHIENKLLLIKNQLEEELKKADRNN